VTIAAYPQSDRNFIEHNTFSNLEGLSIDLNTRDNTSKPFFKLGDGVNPPRNSRNRKRDTANRAINAPQFLSEDFYLIDGRVQIDGVAEPNSQISLYQVESSLLPEKLQNPLAAQSQHYGPLTQYLQTAIADSQGKFSFTLENTTPGTIISAIASKKDYGTSEPAFNAVIKSLEDESPTVTSSVTIPSCTTKPVAKIASPPMVIETPEPEPVSLKVPTNIHFALDKSHISLASGEILQQIATVLIEHPYLTIELQGHTDFRASNQYNLALSKRRAMSARNYLLQQGIKPERMTIRPLGESALKKSGNTILEHAYNRRVEILFRDLREIEIILEEQDLDLQPEE
ncbi:MAG: OmpA family protein, partial [Cyanobacteria bacterium J06600_6]